MALNPNFQITTTPQLLTAISGVASGKARFQNLGIQRLYIGNQDKSGFRTFGIYQEFMVTDVADVYVWVQSGEGSANGSTAV